MFVLARPLHDYRAESPGAERSSLDRVSGGLSGSGWDGQGVVGSRQIVGSEVDAGGGDATRCELGVVTFAVGWGEVAEGGVPAAGVLPALDVLEDGCPCLGAGRRGAVVYPLLLQGGVERFADGVVITIADAAHRDRDPGPLAAFGDQHRRLCEPDLNSLVALSRARASADRSTRAAGRS